MFILILILAVLLIILWSKVNQSAAYSEALQKRIQQLESQLDELASALINLRAGPTPDSKPPSKETYPQQTSPQPVMHPIAPIVEEKPETSVSKIPEKPAALPVPPSVADPGRTPAPPRPAFIDMRAAKKTRRPAWKMPTFDWESLVGVKLFSWIAGVALLFAVVFFLRYSINQGWLMPKVRMTIGILIGIGLLAICELKAAKRYRITANAMDASAIAILFSTFYAARALWGLIGAVPAFALMVAVTAVAVFLSIRRDSAFIALLGLLGGFAAPALLSTGENSPVSLFSYLLILNAGLAWVATKKKWPILMTLSLVFTVFYQWGWVVKFLTDSQLPTALGIFIVFPILAFAAVALGRGQEAKKNWTSLYGQTANITALLPLLFNLYLAAVPSYGQHYLLLFSFLLLLDAGLFIIAVVRGPEMLHLVGGLSTLLIPAIWLWRSYESAAWPTVLVFIVLYTFLYLFAPLLANRLSRDFLHSGKWAVYTAPLILFIFPALAHLEPSCRNPWSIFGILFVLLLGISAYAVYAEKGLVYYIAALFALTAEAIWASRYLNPDRLGSGLILFSAFSLVFIGVPVLARKWRKRLQPEIAGAGVLLAGILLLPFLLVDPISQAAIWGLALLLLFLNIGILIQRKHRMTLAAMVLSWIVLAQLWSHSLNTDLVPALLVMAGFGLFVLAGNIWMQRKSEKGTAPDHGIFLGLTGHLFLIYVAASESLAVPPWPLLCTLLVLDIAIGMSALYLRRNDIHRASIVASALLLMIWVFTAKIAPWPMIAILAAAGLCLLSFLWIYLSRKNGMDPASFFVSAAITVIFAQIISIIAAAQPGAPGVVFLMSAHVLFLAALLTLAWPSRQKYALAAVGPAAVAVSFWIAQHAGREFFNQQLLFAVPIYLLFISFPLILGRRSGGSLEAYLAAVLASGAFFFQARHSIIQAGYANVIGILPVIQALLSGGLVLNLLRIEPPEKRAPGRLAMVAGTALAFITVAIPLQFEEEWITIGWVLEGAALSWLYRKIPHKGLLYTVAGLFTAVFIRLALNPFVLTYSVRSPIRIWNWYLYTYLLSAAAMLIGRRFLAKTEDALLQGHFRLSKIVPAAAAVLLFLLLNIEIADYFSEGPTITFNFSATLAQDLTYTLGWALFAIGLLTVGIIFRNQPARIASLGLLVGTSIKCFIHDLARLGELYRVMSFVGLGVSLALVALALQKFVLAARKEE